MKTIKKKLITVGKIFIVLVVFLGVTAFSQIGLLQYKDMLPIGMSEDTTIGLSGTLGVTSASILFVYLFRQSLLPAKEKFNWKKAVLYGVFAVSFCKIVVAVLSASVLGIVAPMEANVTQSSSNGVDSVWIQLFSVVILAPIAEEFLFRKFLYSVLSKKVSKRISVICCTLVFALMHGYDLYGFVSCVLAGLLFSNMYANTGVVWYSIIAHMLCNAEALICRMLEGTEVPYYYEVNGYGTYHGLVFIVALVIAVVSAVLLNQINKKKIENTVAEEGQQELELERRAV